MQTAKLMNTRLVLQGEVGIYKGLDFMEITLKTPVPTSCNVLTLFGKEKKISVLAHIDDYVSIEHLFYCINEQMQSKYQCCLKSLNFEAKIFGGSEDQFSKEQQESVIKILNNYENIKWEKLTCDSKERPQVMMSATTGKMSFLFADKKNFCLEYLQQREYSFFNKHFLDKKYNGMDGTEIPYFEANPAIRSEFDMPKFEMKDISEKSIEEALKLEDERIITLPIIYKRKAVIKKERALKDLEKLIIFSNENSLINSFKEKNFSLMLRQTCNDKKYIKITQTLFDCRFPLEIDLFGRGKTSGTAFDVAKKSKNEEAIKLLKPFFDK